LSFGNAVGRFRTSTKTITITNTSSLCGYMRPNHDVILRHFVQTSSWSRFVIFQTNMILLICFDIWACYAIWLLEKNWWRVRYRIRTGANPHYCANLTYTYRSSYQLLKPAKKSYELQHVEDGNRMGILPWDIKLNTSSVGGHFGYSYTKSFRLASYDFVRF
jgi:hypothetical protein